LQSIIKSKNYKKNDETSKQTEITREKIVRCLHDFKIPSEVVFRNPNAVDLTIKQARNTSRATGSCLESKVQSFRIRMDQKNKKNDSCVVLQVKQKDHENVQNSKPENENEFPKRLN
jgi:hypothetical protein